VDGFLLEYFPELFRLLTLQESDESGTMGEDAPVKINEADAPPLEFRVPGSPLVSITKLRTNHSSARVGNFVLLFP
jgi:hypothetical protein